MSSKNDKADEIKNLAINGLFDDILHKFGEKSMSKGKEYALSKLISLKEKMAMGEDILNIKFATPFMVFAVVIDEPLDLDNVSLSFYNKSRSLQEVEIEINQDEVEKREIFTDPQDETPPENVPLFASCPESTSTAVTSEIALIEDKSPLNNEAIASPITTSLEEDVEKDALEEFMIPGVVEPIKKSGFQMPVAPGRKSFVTPVSGEVTSKKQNESSTKKRSTSDSNEGKGKSNTKKTKKATFSNAPKNPMNSYMHFSMTARKEVLSEDPSMKVTEVMKEVGIRWKLLEAEEKSPFEKRAEEEKIAFVTQRADYHDKFPEEAEEWENSKKSTKTPQKDKKSKGKKKKSLKGLRKATDISEGEESDEGGGSGEEGGNDEGGECDDRETIGKGANVPTGRDAGNEEEGYQDDFKDSEDEEAEATFTQSTPNPRKDPKSAVVSSSHSHKKMVSRKLPPSKHLRSKDKHFKSATSKGRSDDPPKIPYIDPVAAAIIAAKTVSSLKGIKQTDLPFEEDLIRTKTVPYERCSFPADFIPKVGDKVTFIPESYREFISQLAPNLLSPEDLECIQGGCALQAALVDCTVTSSRPAAPEGSSNRKDLLDSQTAKVLTLKMLLAPGNASDIYNILYVPFSSILLNSDVFLMDRVELKSSLRSSWLIPNAQVRRMFAAGSGSGGFWQESSIYHIRQDMKSNPYHSISVVDLQLERDPRRWFYCYDQGDGLCSPWDLHLSECVTKAKSVPLPRSLGIGHPTAEAVLNHLKSFDFSSVFCYRLTDNAEYCKMFPRKRDRLDLHVISARCKDGCYEGSDGVNTLFQDLEAMCVNGKKFNDSNKDFQPWRLVDMMDKTIADLQLTLREKIGSCSSTSHDDGAENCKADGKKRGGGLMAALDEAEEEQEEKREEELEDHNGLLVTTTSRKKHSKLTAGVNGAACGSQQDKRDYTNSRSRIETECKMEVEEV